MIRGSSIKSHSTKTRKIMENKLVPRPTIVKRLYSNPITIISNDILWNS